MATHPAGGFLYSAQMRPDGSGVWRGRAPAGDQQVSLVGDAPELELTQGRLTLISTWAAPTRKFFLRGSWNDSPPHARVSVRVGRSLELVLETGDTIRAFRGSTGDVAVVVTRGHRLIIAIGAVADHVRDTGITVEADPPVSKADRSRLADSVDDGVLSFRSPRASDPCLRFGIDGREHEVKKGEYLFHDPWHLFVGETNTPGDRVVLAQLGIARAHPGLSRDDLKDSVDQVSRGVDFNTPGDNQPPYRGW